MLNSFKTTRHSSHKYMRIISLIYLTFLLAATVTAYRVILIGPIAEPGSTIIYTFSFFLANVFTEIYGDSESKQLIIESMICGYIFAVLITVVNEFPSPAYWPNRDIYNQVIGHILRFTNAGTIGYLISAFLNAFLISRWKYKLKGKYFGLRCLVAASISEGAATFIAGLITFFGMLPTSKILLVMINALLLKLIYGLVAIWPTSFLVFLLKKNEMNTIPCQTYNPFIAKESQQPDQ